MKKILIIVTVWGCFLSLATFAVFNLPWLLLYVGINSLPNPPQPSITYGEFPFKLVYEIDGKQRVIEDTLICEYDGLGKNEGIGKYIKWKKSYASGNSQVLLLNANNVKGIMYGKEEVVNQEVYYDPGPSEYYMGDDEYKGYEPSFPDASFLEKYSQGRSVSGVIHANELLEKFHIKLISWESSPPIKNTFIESEK